MKIYFFFISFLLSVISSCSASNYTKQINKSWNFADNKIPKEWHPKALSWKIENSTLVNYDPSSRADMFVFDNINISDFIIQADVKIEKEYLKPQTTWAGFHLRSTLPFSEPAWKSGYAVILYPHGAVTAVCMNTEIKYGALFKPNTNSTFTKFAVKAEGHVMQVFVNGKRVLQFTNDLYKSGGISLINFGNKAVFDNIKLRAEIATEPLIKNYNKIIPVGKMNTKIKPLPKIIVKRGKGKTGCFVYKYNGKKFVPDGYNHTVGDTTNRKIPHANFNVGTYNSEENNKILAEMKSLGANVIRVWLWGTDTNGKGIWGGCNSQSLNYDCLNNFIDFLKLATKHKIYVIPILDLQPQNKKYKSIVKKHEKNTDKNISNHNSDILSKGWIEARKQAARDTVGYIKKTAPELLNTILAWSIANEICVVSDYLPFSLTNGLVKVANGKIYDMSDFYSRQKCADESFYFWAKEIAAEIKKAQPDALVTIGMWTSDAHKRAPVNGIKTSEIKDPRFPPRPSVFAPANSGIDFLDIHVYPWQNKFTINPQAHELDKLNSAGIPVLVGEYGVFLYQAKDAKDGAKKIVELRKKCYDVGYAGALLWVWNYGNGLYDGELNEVKDVLLKARKKNTISGK